jgi:hypothetical protein
MNLAHSRQKHDYENYYCGFADEGETEKNRRRSPNYIEMRQFTDGLVA